jgi:hypothetical protein
VKESIAMNTNNPAYPNGMKLVYTIVEGKGGKSFWVRVGAAFPNQDGSLTLKLDALPVNGTLQVREPQSWEDRRQELAKGSARAPGEAFA